jgi:TetR/AcrR family transcriptional regulator, lmrAB and yxaGH operons repressor
MRKPSTVTTGTRTRLLETAGQVFRWQGFHATGLDEILKRSGTPKGSLYHYFPSGKDQLAIEALRYVSGLLERRASVILSSNSDPLRALRMLFEFTAKTLSESGFRDGCPIAAVTLDVASERNLIREACEQSLQKWLDVFVQHFRRAGLTTARAKSIATLCFAALEGGLILSRAQKNIAPLNAIADELIQLIRMSSATPRAERKARKAKLFPS